MMNWPWPSRASLSMFAVMWITLLNNLVLLLWRQTSRCMRVLAIHELKPTFIKTFPQIRTSLMAINKKAHILTHSLSRLYAPRTHLAKSCPYQMNDNQPGKGSTVNITKWHYTLVPRIALIAPMPSRSPQYLCSIYSKRKREMFWFVVFIRRKQKYTIRSRR